MVDQPRGRAHRRRAAWFGALVAGIALCWIVLTPPGAGADEQGHLVRSGALARGHLDGSDIGSARFEGFDLPSTYAVPDPDCYAFRPAVPVSCAAEPADSDATLTLPSSADEYPIWGHLPGGLLSRLPGPAPIWWARIGGAAIAVALLAGAFRLVAADRPLGVAAVLVALTPMAWSIFGVVSPSAMAISGAVALWTGLLFTDPRPAETAGWITAFGWAALALPRRDGLIWACVALVVALGYRQRTTSDWWRSLGLGPRCVIAVSTIVTVGWGLTNDSRISRLVALAPLIVVAAETVRWWWRTQATTPRRRLATLVVLGTAGCVAAAGVIAKRPGGWDRDLTVRVIGETGNNLVEAIGVLGWLDTVPPAAALALSVGAVGVLGAASLLAEGKAMSWATALLLATIVASWVFELYGGNTTGTYWQGRYSLPLLAGIPLLLGTAKVPAAVAARVARCAGIVALVVVNVVAWAAARRWGVGTHGSLMPWDWDTTHTPVPPIVVLAGLAALSIGLVAALWTTVQSAEARLSDGDPSIPSR
ncbi:MAG TPA: DUF2142 domain-containing protein [Desertimonas sp.]|nr:DUF2142 domain-containing protein [Desertimonas sp.]